MQLKKNLILSATYMESMYGKHGNVDIPDKSLKNFLEKHKANFIIFGGDLTEKKENF